MDPVPPPTICGMGQKFSGRTLAVEVRSPAMFAELRRGRAEVLYRLMLASSSLPKVSGCAKGPFPGQLVFAARLAQHLGGAAPGGARADDHHLGSRAGLPLEAIMEFLDLLGFSFSKEGQSRIAALMNVLQGQGAVKPLLSSNPCVACCRHRWDRHRSPAGCERPGEERNPGLFPSMSAARLVRKSRMPRRRRCPPAHLCRRLSGRHPAV